MGRPWADGVNAVQRVPGIYREVVLPRPTDPDPPTGVCAFIGTAPTGPVYAPVALTRADSMSATFGGAGYLGAAVGGFFGSGGQTGYVVRADQGDPDWLDRGLAALAAAPDADLVACPDVAVAPAESRIDLQRALLDHCARDGTRFAVLDSFPDSGPAQLAVQRAALDSRFGALYHPWVRLTDGRVVPPSGHVAGTYALSDATAGVGAAPANLELAGVVDVAPPLGPDEVAATIAAGVNPLRPLPGRGVRVWGASTLAGPDAAEWSAVNVSRLFVTVARWLARIGVGLTFEPNDLALWVRIRRELSDRLWRLWREGALAGTGPEAGFYVKCDVVTNPPEIRAAGMIVTEIGLAPTAPAEFVVVRLVQHDGTTAQI